MGDAGQRLIQADDLTGAADTAVAFAAAGERTVVVPWAAGDLGARLDRIVGALEPQCLAVDTGSRDGERADAARRAGALAGWLSPGRGRSIYKLSLIHI